MGAGAAIVLKTPLTQLDSGAVAVAALGTAGAIAVVIAGWTTSNPTIYRAGLALQIATPNWPRWLVTLAAGAVTTVIACSPFVFTRLLDFVGLYGLLLMPVGAIVVVEHWIFPRIGLTQYWCARKQNLLNWPALISWVVTVVAALILEQGGYVHLFFLPVPVWFATAIIYIVLSYLYGAKEKLPELVDTETAAEEAKQAPPGNPNTRMYYLMALVAVISLLICLVLSLWVMGSAGEAYAGRMDVFKKVILYATAVYFAAATMCIFLKDKKPSSN